MATDLKLISDLHFVLKIRSDQWRVFNWPEHCPPPGERAKSAAVYKNLLGLWKDADPDISVVQQAKAEFAKQ
jgi:hypothetical protein